MIPRNRKICFYCESYIILDIYLNYTYMTTLVLQHPHKYAAVESAGGHIEPIVTQKVVGVAREAIAKATRSAAENILCLPKRFTSKEAAQKFADADAINLRYVSWSSIKCTPKEADEKFAAADEINLRYVSWSGIKYTPEEANQKFADADEINLRYVSWSI